MTLLVAGLSENTLWMVADTFITGGPLDVRDYEHQIKIVSSVDGRALIGFAGDQHSGTSAIELARTFSSGPAAVDYLRSVAKQYPVDFAYGYFDDEKLHLFKVSCNEAIEVKALNIGEATAFEQFQAIRHRSEIDPVPKSISTFILAGRSKIKPPEALSQSVVAMLRLFVERSERDVGGAAIPYLLTQDGAFLCDYVYSVSDPITDQLSYGNLIPHGTSTAGGFGLSLTDLDEGRGIIIYWLQRPGGLIFQRGQAGFDVFQIDGKPSSFLEQASDKLGRPVEIWFGENNPTGPPDRIAIFHDQNGKPTMVMAKFGRDLQFNAIDTSADFRINPASFEMTDNEELSCSVARVTVTEDGSSALVKLLVEGKPECEMTFTAGQLDALIATLSAARMRLFDAVPIDPKQDRSREMVVLDPAWRSEHPPHPSLDGLLLKLRHTGLGWVTFLLPHHEAISLGDWLSRNARR